MAGHEDRLNDGDTPSAADVARELAAWIYTDMRASHAEDLADPSAATPGAQVQLRADYLEAACDLAETAGPFAPEGLAAWIAELGRPGFIEQIPNN